MINKEGYIRLDMVEAYHLACTLIDFVKDTIKQRQGYLEEDIKNLKNMEGTVFNEASKLDVETMGLKTPAEVCITMIDRFCPKAPKRPVTENSPD